MTERQKQYKANNESVCRYCGLTFRSKRKTNTVCDADSCQRQKEADRLRARYLKRVGREL